MKNLRFALSGMVALLFLFGSCSVGNYEEQEQIEIPDDPEDPIIDFPVEPPEPGEGGEPGNEPVPSEPGEGKEPGNEPVTPEPGEGKEPGNEPVPPEPGDGKEPGNEPVPPEPGEGKEPGNEPEPSSTAPVLRISELRTQHEKSKLRAEFIEMEILSAGNLGGVRVFIATNFNNPLVYEFLSVDVNQGDYVVLHLRTYEDACRDEYGGSTDESGGIDSSPSARDFWIPGDVELLRNTDIVYITDRAGRVLDAVLFAEKQDATWPLFNRQDCFTPVAGFLFSQGAWVTADGTIPCPKDAVNSAQTTATRSICRDQGAGNSRSASDWYITVTSGATPGLPNNAGRF